MKLDGLRRTIRAHRGELTMFTVGALLFAAGFFTVLMRSGRIPTSGLAPDAPLVSQPASMVAVGPDEALRAEELRAYVQSRRQHLESAAAKTPRREATGIGSFTAYLSPEEVSGVLGGRRLAVLALQVRLPLQGFEVVQLEVGDSPLSEVVDAYASQARAQLRSELDELERIIPTVTDESFRRVYEEDAELHRRGIELLEDQQPPIVLAVVVRGTLANLSAAAKDGRVRLVDIADEADAGLRSHSFTAVRPDG